jgi:hypothetical protein
MITMSDALDHSQDAEGEQFPGREHHWQLT